MKFAFTFTRYMHGLHRLNRAIKVACESDYSNKSHAQAIDSQVHALTTESAGLQLSSNADKKNNRITLYVIRRQPNHFVCKI